jgi:hypothetical protein
MKYYKLGAKQSHLIQVFIAVMNLNKDISVQEIQK